MLYIPFPFKRCTKCGNYYLPSLKNFKPNKRSIDHLDYWCRPCGIQQAQKWKQEHPDRVQISRAKEDKAKKRKTDQLWRQRNPDRVAKNAHRWRQAHPYQMKKARRKWAVNNSDSVNEKSRRWRKNNPLKMRALKSQRQARKQSLPATFNDRDWTRCLDYWQNRCAYCGRPRGLWHTVAQDHFIPQSKDGGYTPDNILPACHGIHGCNNRKRDYNAEEWLTQELGKRKAKAILDHIQEYFEWVRQQK